MAPSGRSPCGVWPDTRIQGSGRGLAAREVAFRRRRNHEGNQEFIGEACTGRTRWRSAGIRAHRRTDRGGSHRRHHVGGWQSARPLAELEQLNVSLACRRILDSALQDRSGRRQRSPRYFRPDLSRKSRLGCAVNRKGRRIVPVTAPPTLWEIFEDEQATLTTIESTDSR